MKTLKLTLAILLLAYTVGAQNNPAYQDAMKTGTIQMQTDSTAGQFRASANYFERIAQAEPKEWLPKYYAGYAHMLTAVLGKQANDDKDAIYDKAMGFAEQADALKTNDSEIAVLMGYITYMKMAVDPAHRAMSMIAIANNYLARAAVLNPENPRAYFVRGQDAFYTPAAFGGGPAAAKPLLMTAMAKYEKEKIIGPEPSWGKARCAALLKLCR